MDFRKLSEFQLNDFLSRPYAIPLDSRLSKIDQAQLLFEQLKTKPGIEFPVPVIDLYLATIYQGNSPTYNTFQILNLTDEEVKLFSEILGIYPIDIDSRQRILWVLDFLGAIYDPEQLFSQTSVLNVLCKNLDPIDLNNFRMAIRQEKLDCQVPTYDKDKLVNYFNELTNDNYLVINDVRELGSIESLFQFINYKNLDKINILLDAGLDINVKNNKGQTPLIVAVSINNYDVTKFLLDRGADPNIPDRSEFTPLMWAAFINNLDLVKLLLSYHADPNVLNYSYQTVLDIANMNKDNEIASVLRQYGGRSYIN